MRLDPDCVRDILLTAEENTGFRKHMMFRRSSTYPLLAKYEFGTVMYHLVQCKESGLFLPPSLGDGHAFRIDGLSPDGHKFLENIRDEHVHNVVKDRLSKIGVFSLDVFKSIAASVASSIITQHLGL